MEFPISLEKRPKKSKSPHFNILFLAGRQFVYIVINMIRTKLSTYYVDNYSENIV